MKVQIDGKESNPMLVLAHGAGAGQESPVMCHLVEALLAQDICVARFNFEYMQSIQATGVRRPPARMSVLQEEYRRVIEWLDRPCLVGGKSMGGRVATMMMAEGSIPHVRGGVVFGYPFHPVGKRSQLRVEHLSSIQKRVLICQGTRDSLAFKPDIDVLSLPEHVRLHWFEHGDHDFKTLKRSGVTQQHLLQKMAAVAAGFMRQESHQDQF